MQPQPQKKHRSHQSCRAVEPVANHSNTDIVLFRGTQTGLEIQIDSDAAFEAILLELLDKVETSASFFAEAKTTVRFSKNPIPGILANIETIAEKYNLSIVSIRSNGDERKPNLSWIKRINAITTKRHKNQLTGKTASSNARRDSVPPLHIPMEKRVA